MKRLKAAMCAVLAGLMLAGCAVQPQTDNKRGGGAAVDLTKYVVKEAAYPAYPKEPRFEDYFDENGEGDWDAYDAAYTEYREALQSWASWMRSRTAVRCWPLLTGRWAGSSPTARTGYTRPSACTRRWPC